MVTKYNKQWFKTTNVVSQFYRSEMEGDLIGSQTQVIRGLFSFLEDLSQSIYLPLPPCLLLAAIQHLHFLAVVPLTVFKASKIQFL